MLLKNLIDVIPVDEDVKSKVVVNYDYVAYCLKNIDSLLVATSGRNME